MHRASINPLVIPESQIAALAREHLSALARVHLAPDIPPKKKKTACVLHAQHLPAQEPVLVLGDSSVWSNAGEGFLATPARFCWRLFWQHPRAVTWEELSLLDVTTRGNDALIAGGVAWTGESRLEAEHVAAFLSAASSRMRAGEAVYRSAAKNDVGGSAADAIVMLARRALGELDWIFYGPSIPHKLLQTVHIVHAQNMAADEKPLVVYDETVFGSASNGFVLTERGVFWSNFMDRARMRSWAELGPRVHIPEGFSGAAESADLLIQLGMRPEMRVRVARLLGEISTMMRSRRKSGVAF
ncbi:MAG: hypothetical protein IPK82_13050 [Polyangiaceae bacterium]|nr:hypothetical protein [Polyangiaceae bacterium]